jgi:hypothetical protein
MNELTRYLKLIVQPTVEEFRRNPTSLRHAYLACVAAYHAVDRVAYPRGAAKIAKKWRQQSKAFALVEIVALDFKHVKSTKHKLEVYSPRIAIETASIGDMGFNTHMLNDTGELEFLRNLSSNFEEVERFLDERAREVPQADRGDDKPDSCNG